MTEESTGRDYRYAGRVLLGVTVISVFFVAFLTIVMIAMTGYPIDHPVVVQVYRTTLVLAAALIITTIGLIALVWSMDTVAKAHRKWRGRAESNGGKSS